MPLKLREDEQLLMEIKPHPIAFSELYMAFIYQIIINVYLFLDRPRIYTILNETIKIKIITIDQALYIIWAIFNIIPFLIFFFTKSSWRWLLTGIATVVVAIPLKLQYALPEPLIGGVIGVIGTVLTNYYRKGHTYYITDKGLTPGGRGK